MKNKFAVSLLCSAAAFLSLATAPLAGVSAEDNNDIIISCDFDEGDVGKWSAFGGGTLSLDNSVSHSGDSSVRITGRTRNYQGPSIQCDSYFVPGETYEFDGWVYHEGDETSTISLTLKTTDTLGTDSFMQIAAAEIPPNEWVELTNVIQLPEDSSGYRIYFESSNETEDFNIDTVTVKGKQPEDSGETQDVYEDTYNFDFENDTEGWTPRGDLRVMHTDDASQNGNYSIYCANRSAVWNGPTLSTNNYIEKGRLYHYSAYVMYNGEEYEDSHVMRLEVQYTLEGADHYDTVCEKEIKKGKWTRLTGYHTVPVNAENLSVYVQTDNLEEEKTPDSNDLMSFYIDNVTITKGEIVKAEIKKRMIIFSIAGIIAAAVLILVIYKIVKRTLRNNAAIKNASVDAMTKMLNRNAYEKRINEFEKDPKLCSWYYFTLCDVNFLKYINDNFGHEKGDEAITRCAQLLKRVVGKSGEIYRTGGDEFICISKTPIKDAVADAIKSESEKDKGYPFAVACGFAEYDSEKLPDIKSIIKKCDQEMYENKQEIKKQNVDFSRK